jgi:hypothetical protein
VITATGVGVGTVVGDAELEPDGARVAEVDAGTLGPVTSKGNATAITATTTTASTTAPAATARRVLDR